MIFEEFDNCIREEELFDNDLILYSVILKEFYILLRRLHFIDFSRKIIIFI
jgi:hypothetical protein